MLPRTLTQIKKIIKRDDTFKVKLSEFTSPTSKQIWEVEYMTTSDEEDNDSEPDERLEDPADTDG